MCGIAGCYKMGTTPIREWQLIMLANSLEYRGSDATGIALIDTEGRIAIHKDREMAWRFTSSKQFREFTAEHLTENTRIALVHTRKATKGSPYDNDNNHPIYGGKGVVIHNGMIYNDDGLFDANKNHNGWKRSCKTDSDAIRGILDCYGAVKPGIIKEMRLLEGVVAAAAFHPATPDKLLLLRDSNPLILGATADMLMFASDKTALHRALKPWVKVHNVPMQVHAANISFVPMPNNTGWIFGPGGLEYHDQFTANNVPTRGNTKYYPSCDFKERQKRFKEQAEVRPTGPASVSVDATLLPTWVICPGKGCNKHIGLSLDERKMKSLLHLKCGDCNTNLGGAITADFTN